MGRIVLLVAVIIGYMLAAAQARPTDAEAMGRLCLQAVGFVVTTFLFYVALNDVTLPRISGSWRNVIGRSSRSPLAEDEG